MSIYRCYLLLLLILTSNTAQLHTLIMGPEGTILRLPLFQMWRVANFLLRDPYRMWCLNSCPLAFSYHAVPLPPLLPYSTLATVNWKAPPQTRLCLLVPACAYLCLLVPGAAAAPCLWRRLSLVNLGWFISFISILLLLTPNILTTLLQ